VNTSTASLRYTKVDFRLSCESSTAPLTSNVAHLTA
jgi:hypothetical protein